MQQLTESNTVWQIRARQAEERLLELAAGEVPSDIDEWEEESMPEAVESPESDQNAPQFSWDRVKGWWSV